MDTITVRQLAKLYIHWPEGGGFQQIEMLINGVPLIELVREVELPYAEEEFDQRTADGEGIDDLGSRGALAGDYHYLPPSIALPPSQNFFGEPYNHGLLTESDDPVNLKSVILSCTCGVTECWFLMANITLKEKLVVWDNFQQFHRDWAYTLGPLVFDREQYTAAFNAA